MKIVIMSLLVAIYSPVSANPSIDIGILLDSSGSMDGLIKKTQNTIWAVMNSLEGAKKDGDPALLKLGLYSYGNGAHPDAQDEIVLISNLTTDLDIFSQKFFELQATGGSELAGTVIQNAMNNFNWNPDGDFKALFLAGNETIHQGEIKAQTAAEEALAQGIIVNSIYAFDTFVQPINPTPSPCLRCYPFPTTKSPVKLPSPEPTLPLDDPIFSEWQAVALWGGGDFARVSNNETLPDVPTPYDEDILALDTQLTEIVIPFGEHGESSYERMKDVDSQIKNSDAGSYIGRSRWKAGTAYDTTSWDLIEAFEKETVKLETIKMEHLPKALQSLSLEALKKHLLNKIAIKSKIKSNIVNLYEKRALYVKAEREKTGVVTVEQVMVEALKKQLTEQGYTF